MIVGARAILLASSAAAIVVFCVIQDRITARGARQYVTLQQESIASGSAAVAIDDIMTPAVRRGVREGAMSAGGVLAVGAAAAGLVRRRSGRR
jgi:hypothetical protein